MVAISWGQPEVRRHLLDLLSVLLMLSLSIYGWVVTLRQRDFLPRRG